MSDIVNICIPFAPTADDGSARAFDPAWRSETVLALARAIEAEEAFDRMPILADALEEAGCDDEVLLRHCRACENHAHWCWALGKALNRPDILLTPSAPEPVAPQPRSQPQLVQAESNRTGGRPWSSWLTIFMAIAVIRVLISAVNPPQSSTPRVNPSAPKYKPFTTREIKWPMLDTGVIPANTDEQGKRPLTIAEMLRMPPDVPTVGKPK